MRKVDIQSALDRILEALAAIEHERWSSWQRHVHDLGNLQGDGSLLISAELVQRWEVQIETPFRSLSEGEKDSDRDQVRRYLPIIVDALLADTGECTK